MGGPPILLANSANLRLTAFMRPFAVAFACLSVFSFARPFFFDFRFLAFPLLSAPFPLTSSVFASARRA
jgi:hypothetical protein